MAGYSDSKSMKKDRILQPAQSLCQRVACPCAASSDGVGNPILHFGQREVSRNVANQIDAKVKQVLFLLFAQPGEIRNVVLRRIGVTVIEKSQTYG